MLYKLFPSNRNKKNANEFAQTNNCACRCLPNGIGKNPFQENEKSKERMKAIAKETFNQLVLNRIIHV